MLTRGCCCCRLQRGGSGCRRCCCWRGGGGRCGSGRFLSAAKRLLIRPQNGSEVIAHDIRQRRGFEPEIDGVNPRPRIAAKSNEIGQISLKDDRKRSVDAARSTHGNRYRRRVEIGEKEFLRSRSKHVRFEAEIGQLDRVIIVIF